MAFIGEILRNSNSICSQTTSLRWGLFFVIFLTQTARSSLGSSDVGIKGENNGCTSVKSLWMSKGLGSQLVPTAPVSSEQLEVCTTSRSAQTCCTRQMETKLATLARQTYNSSVANKIQVVRELLVTKASNFDVYCTNLIDKSSQDLHAMFLRTYGTLYEQNSAIFSSLFSDLRRYYRGANLNLEDVMDTFFTNLAVRMFTLLNEQYSLTERYVACVRSNIHLVAPFGDVPKQLAVQVKRAFIAARTFYQGLSVGRDVLAAISKMEPSSSCIKAATRMQFCPYCRGLAGVKPCSDFCMNVMHGCLAHHAELNESWNTYADALLKVGGRLEGPFNIENVIQPINVKISDAIMNLQENGNTVSEKIFHACGQPTLSGGRSKRRATTKTDATPGDPLDHQDSDRTSGSSGIGLLIQGIRERLAATVDFWSSLPHAVCNSIAAAPSEPTNCWNGHSVSRYTSTVVTSGLSAQVNNPEVVIDTRSPSSVISQQILQLKLVTNKLKNAYNGHTVDWIDLADDEDSEAGSGSGSDDDGFSGSGTGEVDPDFDLPVHVPTVDRGISFSEATRPPAPVEIVTRRHHGVTTRLPTSTAGAVATISSWATIAMVSTLTVAYLR